jgi:hypothetical protein
MIVIGGHNPLPGHLLSQAGGLKRDSVPSLGVFLRIIYIEDASVDRARREFGHREGNCILVNEKLPTV